MNLMLMISSFGLGIGLIRFLPPSTNKRKLVGTAFSITLSAVLLSSTVFLLGIHIWSPKLSFIIVSPVLILTFIAASVPWVWGPLLDQSFIAFRKAHLALIRNGMFNVGKLLLILLLGGFGVMGIFGSWVIALAFSVTLATLVFPRASEFRFPAPVPHLEGLREMFSFSSANYVAGLLGSVPTTVMPLMVTAVLREEMTAYYILKQVRWVVFGNLLIASSTITISRAMSWVRTNTKPV